METPEGSTSTNRRYFTPIRSDVRQLKSPSQQTPDTVPTEATTPLRRGGGKFFDRPSNSSTIVNASLDNKVNTKRPSKSPTREVESCRDFSFQVSVRVCPSTQGVECLKVKSDSISVTFDGRSTQSFSFQHCFDSFVDQQHVYNTFAKDYLLNSVREGFNSSLFCYGQTGTGKSYSLIGKDGEQHGILLRFCKDLFATYDSEIQQQSMTLEVSFVELYCEKPRDLLWLPAETNRKPPELPPTLKIRNGGSLGPYIENLTWKRVHTLSDLLGWIGVGIRQRATASTVMNDQSSRSHVIFTLKIQHTKAATRKCVQSIVNLVDLAGSERDADQDRLKESTAINKSLTTLGKVVTELFEKKRNPQVYVSYRNSALTMLLKNSLGGNARTAMLATVSPNSCQIDETLSTLRYASIAQQLVNRVTVNTEDNSVKIVQDLERQIEVLKSQLRSRSCIGAPAAENYANLNSSALVNSVSDAELRQQIETLKAELQAERDAKEVERRKVENIKASKNDLHAILKKFGLHGTENGPFCRPAGPALIYLCPDPQLSEVVFYPLIIGQNVLGKGPSASISLGDSDSAILDEHCFVNVDSNEATLSALGTVFLNGYEIKKNEPVAVKHNDFVVFDTEFYFRMFLPSPEMTFEPATTKYCFEAARNKLLEVQNARLLRELKAQRAEKCDQLSMAKDQVLLDMEMQLNQIQQLQQQKIEELSGLVVESKDRHDCTVQKLQNEAAQLREEGEDLKTLIETLNSELDNEFSEQPEPQQIELTPELVRADIAIRCFNQEILAKGKQFELALECDCKGTPLVVVKNIKLSLVCTWTLDQLHKNIAYYRKQMLCISLASHKTDLVRERAVSNVFEKILYSCDYNWEKYSSCSGANSPLLAYTLANAFRKAKRRSLETTKGRRQSTLNTSGCRSGLSLDLNSNATFIVQLSGGIPSLDHSGILDSNISKNEECAADFARRAALIRHKPVAVPKCHNNGPCHAYLCLADCLTSTAHDLYQRFSSLLNSDLAQLADCDYKAVLSLEFCVYQLSILSQQFLCPSNNECNSTYSSLLLVVESIENKLCLILEGLAQQLSEMFQEGLLGLQLALAEIVECFSGLIFQLDCEAYRVHLLFGLCGNCFKTSVAFSKAILCGAWSHFQEKECDNLFVQRILDTSASAIFCLRSAVEAMETPLSENQDVCEPVFFQKAAHLLAKLFVPIFNLFVEKNFTIDVLKGSSFQKEDFLNTLHNCQNMLTCILRANQCTALSSASGESCYSNQKLESVWTTFPECPELIPLLLVLYKNLGVVVSVVKTKHNIFGTGPSMANQQS